MIKINLINKWILTFWYSLQNNLKKENMRTDQISFGFHLKNEMIKLFLKSKISVQKWDKFQSFENFYLKKKKIILKNSKQINYKKVRKLMTLLKSKLIYWNQNNLNKVWWYQKLRINYPKKNSLLLVKIFSSNQTLIIKNKILLILTLMNLSWLQKRILLNLFVMTTIPDNRCDKPF